VAGREIAIFGTGKSGIARLSEDLKDFLESLEIEIIAESTEQAIESYNQAKKQDKKAVAFLHLTC